MKTIKYILLSILCIALFSTCKRKCQDERADNFEEDRKSTCDYSHADNWDKDIIVDSVVINGVKIELENENWYFRGSEPDENYVYGNGGISYYDAEFDDTNFLEDTLESIAYYFAIPVASDYEINKIEGNILKLYYIDGLNDLKKYERDEAVFNFIEERTVNEVKYRFYSIEIDNLTNENIFFNEDVHLDSYVYISTVYDLFSVRYELIFSRIL